MIYVIYLPSLAAQAGVPKHAVAWILLMDQVIFIACDWIAGIHADRVAAALGRVGPRLAIAALISCVAFILLPWIAPTGSAAAFIAVTALWSATSSALRAPPLTLTGRHATAPERPWIASVYMLGLGLAAAAAPYLGARLRGVDPRIPFAISTAMVVAATFALVVAERRLRVERPVPPQPTGARPQPAMLAMFAVAVALFAIGFQLHFSVNSSRQYLRFAAPEQLESLMPVFWIGFNLAMLPAALITRRYGGLAVMAVGGMVAVVFFGRRALRALHRDARGAAVRRRRRLGLRADERLHRRARGGRPGVEAASPACCSRCWRSPRLRASRSSPPGCPPPPRLPGCSRHCLPSRGCRKVA